MAETQTKEREKEDELASQEAESSKLAKVEEPASPEHEGDHDEHDEMAPAAQLGERRFVYGAYFGGGITVAFIVSKLLHNVWLKLASWKPQVGEPKDEILFGLSALIGVAVAVYYWRRTRARQLAEEVAQELSKVTWPSKQEVTSSTFVVIVTTAIATVFFALMDRFWAFVTNFVYGI